MTATSNDNSFMYFQNKDHAVLAAEAARMSHSGHILRERVRILREALEIAHKSLGVWHDVYPECLTENDESKMVIINAALEQTK